MPVTFADVIIMLILFGFVFSGFWFGLIHMVGSFASIIIAAVISGRYFDFVSEKLGFLFGGYGNLGKVITFVLLFILVTRLVGLVFWLINKAFHLLTFIPFLKTFNRLGGALLGFGEGLVLCSLALYMLARFPLSDGLTQALSGSIMVDKLLNFATWMAPLLPDVIQRAQQFIPS